MKSTDSVRAARAWLLRRNVLIALYAVALFAGIALAVTLAEKVYGREGLWFDRALLAFFAAHRSATLDVFFRAVSWVGSAYVLAPLTALLVGAFLVHKRRAEAVLISIGFAGAGLLTLAAKHLLARQRPGLFPQVVEPPLEPAFPSGHTTLTAALALTLFLVIHHHRPRWQVPAGLGLSLAVLAVAVARVYLQVHYPSDVLGGVLLAAAWVLGINALLQWRRYRGPGAA